MSKRKFIMKLRIKPEHNPPKIGNSTEEGLIATQEFSVPKNTEINTMFYRGLIEMEYELMKNFCEVITEEIK